MNGRRDNFDLGDSLNAAPLPIATESRLFVFLPVDWAANDAELLDDWVKWGGKTEFVTESKAAHEQCGICIFRRGTLGQTARKSVVPFYDKGGAESNVFEFIPEEKLFRRMTRALFDLYYPIQ